GMSYSFATDSTISKSTRSIVGLICVSIYINEVSSLICALISSSVENCVKSTDIWYFSFIIINKPNVHPYKPLEQSTWPPAFVNATITAEIAPIPELKASPCSPLSNAPLLPSNTLTVVVPSLEYIYPESSPLQQFAPCAAELNSNVDV